MSGNGPLRRRVEKIEATSSLNRRPLCVYENEDGTAPKIPREWHGKVALMPRPISKEAWLKKYAPKDQCDA